MQYEVHVGDYVKTRCGHIGYISKIDQLSNGHTILYICYTDGKTFPCYIVDRDIEHSFDRIGQYDFTQQDKKIEKMQTTFTSSNYNDDGWHIKSILELRQKVNELIDAVNEKYNNCRLRYPCDEQTEFICKHNNYCEYISE